MPLPLSLSRHWRLQELVQCVELAARRGSRRCCRCRRSVLRLAGLIDGMRECRLLGEVAWKGKFGEEYYPKLG